MTLQEIWDNPEEWIIENDTSNKVESVVQYNDRLKFVNAKLFGFDRDDIYHMTIFVVKGHELLYTITNRTARHGPGGNGLTDFFDACIYDNYRTGWGRAREGQELIEGVLTLKSAGYDLSEFLFSKNTVLRDTVRNILRGESNEKT